MLTYIYQYLFYPFLNIMNTITRQHIVGMKYEEHENDNQTRIMLGFAYNFWLSKERKSRIELGSLNLSFQPITTTLVTIASLDLTLVKTL